MEARVRMIDGYYSMSVKDYLMSILLRTVEALLTCSALNFNFLIRLQN